MVRCLTLRRFARPVFAAVLAALAFALGAASAEARIVLQDIKGRTVTLAAPAQRLVVDDGRMIIALSFLSNDPVGLIAAWPHDVDRFGLELYASYRARFPQIDSLPRSGSNAQGVNAEQILAVHPDAVLLSVYSRPAEQQLRQLDQAGVPVIFVDFVADPLANTDRSLEIIGKAIGREVQAGRVVALREKYRAAIAEKVAGVADDARPAVFMETHASTREACCNSPGAAGLGKFLQFVRARNIGDILGDRPSGRLSLEYVVSAKPDVYIASGGEYMKARAGLLIGPHFDAGTTRGSMDALLARPGISLLPAVKKGATHGISQQLFSSPLDILALALLAKWTHPDLFRDLDVDAAREQLNDLMAVPLDETYWTK
jgi:iron complex transport system substrate-binding protein